MPSVRRGVKRKRSKVELLIPDVHIPEQNQKAVEWAVREGRDHCPRGVTILGDTVNVNSLSRFKKTMKMAGSLCKEVKQGREFYEWFDKQFRKARIRYMLGNHEARVWSYLVNRAPELSELPELAFKQLFGVPERWEVHEYGNFVKEQGVLLQHGKKWGQATCRSNLLLGCSSVQGHSHRVRLLDHRYAGSRKIVTAAELGCLCNFGPSYSKLTDWCHAYGFLQDGQVSIITRR